MNACPESNHYSNEIVVSVLATAYNQERWIARALESIVMQKTNFPIEILVHDDASTDKTADIIREYEQKYPRLIKPIYQTKNQFSQGHFPIFLLSEKAKGKYLAICEGDDYWTDPLKLQKQVDLLEAHPECSMAVAKTDVYCLKDGQFHYQSTYEGVDKDLVYFDDLFKGFYFHTSTYLIPKINFIAVQKYRDRIFLGDTAVRFILIDIGPFVFLRETVSVYQITGEGIWTKLNSYEQAVIHIKLFEDLFNHFKPRYKKYWAKTLVSYYITIIFADIRERRLGNLPHNIVRLAYLGLRYAPLRMLKQIFSRLLRFIYKKMNGISKNN
jgi:glycosyltransferase involved in cell wall biosynthesis